jgi:hypothetical protein
MHVLTLYQLVADRRDELAAMAASHRAPAQLAPGAARGRGGHDRRALLRILRLAR